MPKVRKDKKNKSKEQPSQLMLNRQAAIDDMTESMLIMEMLEEHFKVQPECEESESASEESQPEPQPETPAHS